MKAHSVLFVVGVSVTALCQDASDSKIVRDIEKTRASIKGQRAMYKWEIRVKKTKRKESPDKLSRGIVDEDLEIGVSIDANGSCLQEPEIPPMKGQPHLGSEQYYVMPDHIYAVIEGGMRGGFGPWSLGPQNPLSYPFEINSRPIRERLKGYQILRETDTTLEAYQGEYGVKIEAIRDGDKTYLAKESGWKRGSAPTWSEVRGWQKVDGEMYPTNIFEEIGDATSDSWQTREYRLLKFYGVPKERIAPKYLEGATVKDHEKNLVYTVKNGKFVLDPRFSKNVASDTTWRRIGFVGSVLLVGGGATWWLVKRRRNAATAKLSS
jgi:hypothetical protein